jgi:two-component system, cell cycle sensor histidine kinase and response regulator CckA
MTQMFPQSASAGAGSCLAPTGLLLEQDDGALDRLTQLASRVLGAPIALTALRIGDELLFKSQVGLPEPFATVRRVPLAATVCREPLLSGSALVVPDIEAVGTAPPGSPAAVAGVRAYAAVPLVRASGESVGVFSVMDPSPRPWSETDIATLHDLAASVMTEIEWRISAAERGRAAEELQRNAAILAGIPDAVVVTDPAGHVRYWNDGATSLFGWTAEEMLGSPLAERVPAELRPRFAAELERALAGDRIHGEYQDVRKDGGYILTDTRVSLIRDETGRAAAVLRISRDITEQRLLGRVLEEMPEAVVCLDAADRIVSCNAAAERTFGYTAAELLGQPVRILSPEKPPGAAPTRPDILALTRRDGGWSGEVVRRRKDGSHFPVRLVTGVVRDSQGRIVGQAGLLRDLTEEKHREAQLRRAERLTSLGTLLAGLAHELNNPLTSIKSFAQLLLLDERPAEDREGLEVIHHEADRAAQLVADLRLLARQTREMAVPTRELIDLNELVRQVLASRFGAEVPPFRVHEELAEPIEAVWGDRVRLEQMVRQLVLNAEQALRTADAPGELTVRTRVTGECLELSVIDTGPGISASDLDRIFDPFWTTKSPGEGLGLGLSMVHGIVAEHGAEIRVDSELGRGSTFTVEFQLPGGQEPSEEAKSLGVRPLRVLLVDDEPAIRLALARFLEQRGHEVGMAENGFAALDLLERGPAYDVVVSDLRMPGLSGGDLYRRIREKGAAAPRVIVVSGDPDGGGDAGLFASAGVPLVRKPFDLLDVARLVERVGLDD